MFPRHVSSDLSPQRFLYECLMYMLANTVLNISSKWGFAISYECMCMQDWAKHMQPRIYAVLENKSRQISTL